MVFDLINRDIASKISDITKEKWLGRDLLVIMSPDSVSHTSTDNGNFFHGNFIKYVYPQWDGSEKTRFSNPY